jgi:hypothetical protein
MVVRSSIEAAIGKIGLKEYFSRFSELLKNKLHNLEELMEFDKENKVFSTFFVGVNRGCGMCYSLEDSQYWIKKIKEKGFDVGVHGVEFNNLEGIKKEYETFKKISGLSAFGIRMHYLRNCEDTIKCLNETGYTFDSTTFKMENPFNIGDLWEFPLHVMDGYLFNKNGKWQNQTLKQAKEATKAEIDRAYGNGIEYFTILFHDRFFSRSFKAWKEWYIWLVGYLTNRAFEFITYREAIQELAVEG